MSAKKPTPLAPWPTLRSLVRAQNPLALSLYFIEAVSTSLLQGISLLLIVPLLAVAGLIPATGAQGPRLPEALAPWLAEASLEAVMLVYLGIVGAYALLRLMQQRNGFALEEDFTRRLRQRAVGLVCGARWVVFHRRSQAELMQFINEETERAGFLAQHFFGFITQATATAILFSLSLWVAPELTLALGLWGLTAWLLLRPVNRAGQRAALALQQARRRILRDITHLLEGFKSLKVNHQERQLAERLLATSADIARAKRRFFHLNSVTGTGLELGGALTVVVVVFFCLRFGQVGFDQLLTFVLLLARLMPKTNALTHTWQRLGNLLATYASLQQFLTELEAEQEPAAPRVSQRYRNFRELALSGVEIGHSPEQGPLIRGVNLRLRANTTTLITGASGSGKTTLLDVLAGLLPPTRGSLTLDGEAVEVQAWRDQISYMTQFPFLQNGSVAENLRWMAPTATEAALWSVLERVRLAATLRQLPLGLQTPVGDNAGYLSGGEKQRLALAMHLLKEAHVLIFDEVTSALDQQNRRAIIDVINSLHGQYTIVVVSHDLGDLAPVDLHLHLEGGMLETAIQPTDPAVTPGRSRRADP